MDTIEYAANIANKMSIMGNVLGHGTVAIYMIQRFFQIVSAEMNGLERDFVLQSFFPQIFKATPNYHLVCLSQLVGGFMITACYVSIDCLIYMLMFNVCAQLQILRKELYQVINSLGAEQFPEEFQKAISIVVKKHEHLNWCVATVEDCFNFCYLVQAALSTLLICFQAFMTFQVIIIDFYWWKIPCVKRLKIILSSSQAMAISDSFPVNDIMFLVVYITVILLLIYFFCYMGETLIASSSELSNGIFESNWYSLSPRNLKMLMFIVLRCKTPLQLTAGKFYVFSMETYTNIVKAAAGYFSVMVQLETGRQ
ncbi:odorant receptor 9a-like isoform X1 [Prorops nasuta]|uniref:odorant receptor 9a-like isoform X1 n=1 Tax=Prorops nasuta TaxID=863751 RepID=UPI0034CE9243